MFTVSDLGILNDFNENFGHVSFMIGLFSNIYSGSLLDKISYKNIHCILLDTLMT